MTPARTTPLRRVNLVESRRSINRLGGRTGGTTTTTTSPLSSGLGFKNGTLGAGSCEHGSYQSNPPPPTRKRWLVLVKGPPILPHSPPPNEASGFARAYGASGRYDGGVLMPLQQSLSAQVALIAREFSLPSIGGVALYLCLTDSTRSNNSIAMDRRRSRATSASVSTLPDDVSSHPASMMSTNEYHHAPEMFKPRILEETWGTLWSAFLDPLALIGDGAVQGPFGPSLAIAGILEFDIDPRRAHWLSNCFAASSDPNEYHHSMQPTLPPTSSMSTPTLSAPPLQRHAARGSEVTQSARSGSQVFRRGSSVSYVWHQPDEEEGYRSMAPERSVDKVPHDLVRSTLGGHFGDRDDSNFDPHLDRSFEGSAHDRFTGMMLRDMNDVGFEDEDQDSEEPDSDVPSDVTSHDEHTTNLEVIHGLRGVEVGQGSAAFESFDHFLTSTPGPSSARAHDLDRHDGPSSPSRQGTTTLPPELLTERTFLDEHNLTTLVEDDDVSTPIGHQQDVDHEGVALLDLTQSQISPRYQVSGSDSEQNSGGDKSGVEEERKDARERVEEVDLQNLKSLSRQTKLDLLHDRGLEGSAAVVDEPELVAGQTAPPAALQYGREPATSTKVTYPYFQLYPPHPPHLAPSFELPSTPSPTSGSFSKLMSSPNRRGAPPSPLQLEQHRSPHSSNEAKELAENGDQEVHALDDDPKVVTESGQPWDEMTPQDAIFAEYAQASPSGYDDASSGFPQEIGLNQVDEAKLKNGPSDETGLALSPSPDSASSSSGSSVSTTFERALKTSGHRNVLSLGESDTGSDIMPLSALFQPPPSGDFNSSFDFQPGPSAITTNSSQPTSLDALASPARRPPSPTLNATELNSTSSNISAFVLAMGHPDDGVPFVSPAQEDLRNKSREGGEADDSMDSEMGNDKNGPKRTSFDLHQPVPSQELFAGLQQQDEEDDDEEDSDDEAIELGEDQSCQIFDHLPASPLPEGTGAEVSTAQQLHMEAVVEA